jgi:hypothetical protein
MRRLAVFAALAALVVTGTLRAGDSPEVQALKTQVKTLRTQRDATTKMLHAQYDAVINQTKQTDAQLHAARTQLLQQEQALGATSNSAESQTMQSNMELLRKAMHGEITVNGDVINKLRAQRSNHINLVTAAYNNKIKELEAQIKVASKAASASNTKPKK